MRLRIGKQHAHISHRTPTDDMHGHAFGTKVAGKRLECHVGRHVIGLSGIAQEHRSRREHHEEIGHDAAQHQIVSQSNRSSYLRTPNFLTGFGCQIDKSGVGEHTRSMDDTHDRRQTGQNLIHRLEEGGRLARCDVKRRGHHFNARIFNPSHKSFSVFRSSAGAREQHQCLGSALNHAFGHLAAKAAKAARHNNSAFHSTIDCRLFSRRRRICFIRDNQLADMVRLLHGLEGFLHAIRRKERHRKRTEVAVFKVLEHFGKEFVRQVRTVDEHLVDVDPEVGEITAEGTQEHRRISIEVALAQLQEPAERRKQSERLFRTGTRQRIEHQIHPSPVRIAPNFVGKGKGARVVDMLDAQTTKKRSLGIGSGRRIDFESQKIRNLNGRKPGTTRSAVDQNRLAATCATQIRNGVPGCKEDDGHGCRFGKRQIRRHLRHGLGLRRDDGTKTRRGKAHYCISRHNVRDVLTNSRHDAGCFKPHGGTREPIFQSFFRQQPHRPHYVTEVEPRRANGNAHLVGRKHTVVHGHILPVEVIKPPRHIESQHLGRALTARSGRTHLTFLMLRHKALVTYAFGDQDFNVIRLSIKEHVGRTLKRLFRRILKAQNARVHSLAFVAKDTRHAGKACSLDRSGSINCSKRARDRNKLNAFCKRTLRNRHLQSLHQSKRALRESLRINHAIADLKVDERYNARAFGEGFGHTRPECSITCLVVRNRRHDKRNFLDILTMHAFGHGRFERINE